MAKFISNAVLLTALIQGALAWENGVDCTTTTVDVAAGLFFVVSTDGTFYECDNVADATTGGGVLRCGRTTGVDDGWDDVKCPGDPAPKRNPDGSDTNIGENIVQAYCDGALEGPAPIDFANTVGCLLFSYYEDQADPIAQEEEGAKALCDTVFIGACTWFINVAPELAEGMDVPCDEDANSGACQFIAPGKHRRRHATDVKMI